MSPDTNTIALFATGLVTAALGYFASRLTAHTAQRSSEKQSEAQIEVARIEAEPRSNELLLEQLKVCYERQQEVVERLKCVEHERDEVVRERNRLENENVNLKDDIDCLKRDLGICREGERVMSDAYKLLEIHVRGVLQKVGGLRMFHKHNHPLFEEHLDSLAESVYAPFPDFRAQARDGRGYER